MRYMANCIGKVFSDELFDFCKTVFEKTGVPKDDAEIVSEHLVRANLRGVDSHGVFVRLHHYVSAIKQGIINPRPNIKFVKDTSGACLIDGDNGLGPVVAMKATELAVKKARSNGVCVVGVRNTGHVGMLARYTLKAVEEKMIGFAATSSPPIVVPWGGAKPVFGTNPFSIGFPVDENFSIIVDMATSTVAAGKIAVYASKGEKIPSDWALDKNGKPTTDPKAFLDGGMLLPFGGYKGYSLCLSVEVLAGILVGAPFSHHIPRGWATQGGFVVEIVNIEHFRPYEDYRKDMLELIEIIKSAPLAEGFKEILLPGEPEHREYLKRLKEGIPVYEDVWENIKRVAEEYNVPLPKLY
ncbi:MAG: Ldh family oxidoreductase [Nitrososphaeria archaeon]